MPKYPDGTEAKVGDRIISWDETIGEFTGTITTLGASDVSQDTEIKLDVPIHEIIGGATDTTLKLRLEDSFTLNGAMMIALNAPRERAALAARLGLSTDDQIAWLTSTVERYQRMGKPVALPAELTD